MILNQKNATIGLGFYASWGKIKVLTRATRNGLAGQVVARGLPVAHPCVRVSKVYPDLWLGKGVIKTAYKLTQFTDKFSSC